VLLLLWSPEFVATWSPLFVWLRVAVPLVFLTAQPTPGTEASAAPARAPPKSRSALPREMLPLASPRARSSKECSAVERLWPKPFLASLSPARNVPPRPFL
jgi:hypothetical protein